MSKVSQRRRQRLQLQRQINIVSFRNGFLVQRIIRKALQMQSC